MSIEERLEAAIDHHRNGRLDKAMESYEAILAENPEHVHTLSLSAIVKFQYGDAEAAISRLKTAIGIAPGIAALHNNLGNVYRETDQLEPALEAYRAALDVDPGHVESLCNVGVILRNLGHVGEGLGMLERAHQIDDRHVETNHNLGVTYGLVGRLEEAADCIERCYVDNPVPVADPAWHAHILVNLGRRERAIEIFENFAATRPEDEVAQHHLKALKGEAVERAPDGYVRDHFDQFADSFDTILESLDYRAPQFVAERVGDLVGDQKVRVILDLGCGTGLVGPLVRTRCEHMIGVDLSRKMLIKAAARECYDQLVEAELVKFLNDIPENFAELAVCADTLCYFGELDEVFAGVKRGLKPGGAFIATVERNDNGLEDGVQFLVSGRYSHSEPYIAAAAERAGLILEGSNRVVLRREFDDQIHGNVFVLQKPPH